MITHRDGRRLRLRRGERFFWVWLYRPWPDCLHTLLIGSIRRECLNHVIVFNDRHLKRLLRSYFACYHAARTNLALEKQCPQRRPFEEPGQGIIFVFPHLGGLHHEYRRAA